MIILYSSIALLVIVVVVIAIGNDSDTPDFNSELERLRLEYESTLQGTDRTAALKASRSYYSTGRKGRKLTMFDELALSNDLSKIPHTIYSQHLSLNKNQNSLVRYHQ